MFKALEASGLRGFMGCPFTLYEREMEQFFDTAIVQEGDITCAVSGKYVAISESRFAGFFELPTEGLTDISVVPKDLSDPAVTLGEAKTFPPLKILIAKTVNTYDSTNKTIDARGETDEPEVAKVAIVKRKRASKKKSVSNVDKDADVAHVGVIAEKAVSKKRPAAVSEAHVVKKKRTSSGKAVSKEKDLAIVSVALDVAPIQTIDPTFAMPAAHPPAPKRKEPKRKLRMTAGSDDEFFEKESAVKTVVVEQKATTSIDDVNTIIGEVIAATEQLETDVVESDSTEDLTIRTDLTEQVEPRSDDITVAVSEGSTAVTNDEDMEPFSKALETSVAHLPKIAATDKGKKSLAEPDTVQGHPAREQFQLICGDIDFLILLREKVITEMDSFFHYFSLSNLKAMRSVKDILSKEDKMLAWARWNLWRQPFNGDCSSLLSLQQILEPSTAATATDINEQFAQLRTSISEISIKQLRTQNLRKEVKDLKADLSKEFDDKVAVILMTKKGEVSSSHGRGQPPPGDGGSGGSKSEPSRKRGSSGSRQKSWRYWLNE
ncbi:hypothetical protein F511_38435 [Dorcoceras hygrometricum]|uniref:Splicing factor 3B subunit 1-like n=1 Tax=Dorcoceras hygrometricum TaxID=472368 RepID=A0A2Z7B7X0_9LAMI|nr:hypothetical protein F511_38435 [Dorcoceras hygrometricum]